MNVRHPSRHKRERRGAALVEFAVVLPLVLLLVLGAIELGHAIYVQHTLQEAARAGCRLYSVKDQRTETDVRRMVDSVMTNAKLTGYTTKLEPTAATVVLQLDPLTVAVSVPYAEVAIFRKSWFLSNRVLTGSCTMPADTGE
jgi:Flp pilus assembly protein TadG